jgi:hypothetical protein
MLTSIHPLGERARNNHWSITVTAFTLASVAVAAGIGTILGALGGLFSIEPRWAGSLAAAAAILAAVADLAGIRAPGPERQVNERWIGEFRGWVYGAGFGGQLGAGIATFVVTWGIYAVFVTEFLAGGAIAGALIGSVFGFGRAGLLIASIGIDRPSRLLSFNQALASMARPAHFGIAATMLLFVLGTLL